MIRFRIAHLLLAKEEAEGRSITLAEVGRTTGVSPAVLSNLTSVRGGVVTNTRYVEALIRYFACTPNDLMELVPPVAQGGAVHVDELYPRRP